MSRQLTDAELSAPDVILKIPAGARLPKSVKDLLFGYSGYSRGNCYVYQVAGYVARDIEQALRAAQPALALDAPQAQSQSDDSGAARQ